jgi:hypothetical protein
MKIALEICLVVILAGIPAHLFYWNLFQPILIKRIKYRLFAARDELRLGLATGIIGPKEKAYPIVEMFCNHCIVQVDHIDISTLLSHRLSKTEQMEAEKIRNVIADAGLHIRQIHEDIWREIVGAATVNSPGVLAPIAISLLLGLWFVRAREYYKTQMDKMWAVISSSTTFSESDHHPGNFSFPVQKPDFQI